MNTYKANTHRARQTKRNHQQTNTPEIVRPLKKRKLNTALVKSNANDRKDFNEQFRIEFLNEIAKQKIYVHQKKYNVKFDVLMQKYFSKYYQGYLVGNKFGKTVIDSKK